MAAILVPVDGSAHALKALLIACDLADKYGARVALLHVLDPNRPAADILRLPVASSLPAGLTASLKKTAGGPVADDLLIAVGEKILADAETRVQRRSLETHSFAIERGDPAENILVAAQHAGANTIVMGCRGLSDEETATFGSVSQKVFQKAECTCISVK